MLTFMGYYYIIMDVATLKTFNRLSNVAKLPL